jgi:hypothetical protein
LPYPVKIKLKLTKCSGEKMQTLLAVIIFIICTVLSSPSIAAGSEIRKSLVINATQNHRVINAALDTDANANTGTVYIRVSKITKSTIINGTVNRKIINVASGQHSTGNVGSLEVF